MDGAADPAVYASMISIPLAMIEFHVRHSPGVSPAAQSTILPSGDRPFDLDGGRDGAIGPYPSSGGVLLLIPSFLFIDSI